MEISGGDKLEKALLAIADKMKGTLRVGFLENAKYDDGTHVAQVAFWNEYGHGGRFPAPPRPFFRTTVFEMTSEWAERLAGAVKHFNYDGESALKLMGQTMTEDVQEGIRKLNAPALSPTTLMLRSMFGNNPQEIRARDVLEAQRRVAAGESGASGTQGKPLVWTGQMLNSVDYDLNDL